MRQITCPQISTAGFSDILETSIYIPFIARQRSENRVLLTANAMHLTKKGVRRRSNHQLCIKLPLSQYNEDCAPLILPLQIDIKQKFQLVGPARRGGVTCAISSSNHVTCTNVNVHDVTIPVPSASHFPPRVSRRPCSFSWSYPLWTACHALLSSQSNKGF